MKVIDKAIKAIDRNYQGDKEITIKLTDPDGNLEDLIHAIDEQSRGGHCLTIKLDEGFANHNQLFCFDGDGSDRIYDISVKTTKKDGES